MAEVLTKETRLKRRVNNGEGIQSGLYYGSVEGSAALDVSEPIQRSDGRPLESVVVPQSENWENSEGRAQLMQQIEDLQKRVRNQYERRSNIAPFPDDYYDLVDKIRIDITRLRMEEMDYAPEMTQEIVNAAFSRSVNLDEFLPFGGVFESMTGTNNSVPLIQQKSGATGAVSMILYALGHARSLEDELYNLDIFSLEKVNRAVTRAFTALRNDLTVGQLVAKTNDAGWDSSQQEAAASGGTTSIQDMYDTLNGAIDRLMNLVDPQTEQEIVAPRMVLLCKPSDVRRINRAINGELNEGGKGQPANYAALTEITELWPYRGDTIHVGEKAISYPGVPNDTAYLFVPGPANAPAWTLTKRGLTQEMGRGDVFQLARDKRAWYFAQGEYLDEFFGSSATGTSLGSGYGWVVEVSLPSA